MPATFETKGGEGSGAGYERWRSWEMRPSTRAEGKEDVYVPHHRLLAVVECYPLEMPLEEVLEDLDGKDVHHRNAVKWDNRPSNIETIPHDVHSGMSHELMVEKSPTPDADGVTEVPADD